MSELKCSVCGVEYKLAIVPGQYLIIHRKSTKTQLVCLRVGRVKQRARANTCTVFLRKVTLVYMYKQ
jgi:hypothetical protein